MPTQVDVLTLPLSLTGSNLANIKFTPIAASPGDNTIVAAVVGKKIRVINFMIVASGVATARFESGAGGTPLTGVMALAANGQVNSGFSAPGHFETAVNTLLNLEVTGGAITCDGWLAYVEVT